MSTERFVVWKGRTIRTFGDLMTYGIDACATREEAREFMALYRAVTVHAHENVGMAAGYYDSETSRRIYDWFQTAHPVFGTYEPSPEEAFDMGQRSAGKPADPRAGKPAEASEA